MTDLPQKVERVGIIGSGVIGASWASLFLAAGKEVRLFDPSPTVESDTRAYIAKAWPSLEALGLVRSGAAQDAIQFFADPAEAAANTQFVQESIPEQLPLKLETFKLFEPALAHDTVVATSSSGLLLKDMQEGWKDPSRFILGHPFNPPHLIPLVELLGNEKTTDGVLEWAERFYEDCGKVTIRVKKEVPAHVANRLQAALWREAIHLVLEGVASLEDVDKAITAGPGLRWAIMGPHMLFSLASGGAGMEEFCRRYRKSHNDWWETMGTPTLNDEVGRVLAQGVEEEARGRGFEELAAERDRKLIAILKALR